MKKSLLKNLDIEQTLLKFSKSHCLKRAYPAPGNKIVIMFDKQYFKNKLQAVRKFKSWFKWEKKLKTRQLKLKLRNKQKHKVENKSIQSIWNTTDEEIWNTIDEETSFLFTMPDYIG